MTSSTTAPVAPPVVDVSGLVVGILGGTGPQGCGLAVRLAAAGQRVVLGSREAVRGAEIAAAVAARARTVAAGEVDVRGDSNAAAVDGADVVVVAVPFEGHRPTLVGLEPSALVGKIVVDCVVPMAFDQAGAYVLDVPEGSATQQAAALLPHSTVVGAFHHLSAVLLEDLEHQLEGDVLVVGDDRRATDTVQALADRVPGLRGVYAGRLRNARQVEALTANLVSINRRYKAHAGLRVTDV